MKKKLLLVLPLFASLVLSGCDKKGSSSISESDSRHQDTSEITSSEESKDSSAESQSSGEGGSSSASGGSSSSSGGASSSSGGQSSSSGGQSSSSGGQSSSSSQSQSSSTSSSSSQQAQADYKFIIGSKTIDLVSNPSPEAIENLVAEWQGTANVTAGDVISFTNGAAEAIDFSKFGLDDGCNATWDSEAESGAIIDTCENANIYLKKWADGGMSFYITGKKAPVVTWNVKRSSTEWADEALTTLVEESTTEYIYSGDFAKDEEICFHENDTYLRLENVKTSDAGLFTAGENNNIKIKIAGNYTFYIETKVQDGLTERIGAVRNLDTFTMKISSDESKTIEFQKSEETPESCFIQYEVKTAVALAKDDTLSFFNQGEAVTACAETGNDNNIDSDLKVLSDVAEGHVFIKIGNDSSIYVWVDGYVAPTPVWSYKGTSTDWKDAEMVLKSGSDTVYTYNTELKKGDEFCFHLGETYYGYSHLNSLVKPYTAAGENDNIKCSHAGEYKFQVETDPKLSGDERITLFYNVPTFKVSVGGNPGVKLSFVEELIVGTFMQFKLTDVTLNEGDALSFAKDDTAIDVIFEDNPGNNVTTDGKIKSSCKGDIYLKVNDDDSISVWVSGYTDYETPMTIRGTVGDLSLDADWTKGSILSLKKESQTEYIAILELTTDDEFKFHMGNSWYGYEQVKSGIGSDILADGLTDNLKVKSAGTYVFYISTVADGSSDNIWIIKGLPTMNLMGSIASIPACDWTTGTPVSLEDNTTDEFKVTLTLTTTDELKFKTGTNWFGYSDVNGGKDLLVNADNIKVAKAGTYTFYVKLVDSVYKIYIVEETISEGGLNL